MATVRIPELPSQVTLALEDRFAVWVASDNKTRYATLSTLRQLMIEGDTTSAPPVVNGGVMIYVVPSGAAYSNIASIPSLAGKNFLLRREGRPLIPQQDPAIPEAEYEVLAGGGFKLLKEGDLLIEGERFELVIYELQSGVVVPGNSGGAFIRGVVNVTTNLTLNATDHYNKLVQLRTDGSGITVTLPDVSQMPDNSIIPIETAVGNTHQSKIQTQGGQFIYMRNTGVTALYMGLGETLWLFAGEDGWYVINDFAEIYNRVGKIEASYKVGLNEVYANGALLSRAAYPRLWEYAQTLGSSLVSDAVWSTVQVTIGSRTIPYPYRGCYSTGDGSTTFRIPDLRNMALRGLLNDSGSDAQRYLNKPGGYQRHEIEAHVHSIVVPTSHTSQTQDGNSRFVGGSTGFEPVPMSAFDSQSFGGNETRMDNIGVLWTIKV